VPSAVEDHLRLRAAATSPPSTDIDPTDFRRLSPQPLSLKHAQNLGDLKQLLKPLQYLLQ